tara:strand:- start:76 stop:384 length:309 start_codon:yes stop_codon:yes gene_type:complete
VDLLRLALLRLDLLRVDLLRLALLRLVLDLLRLALLRMVLDLLRLDLLRLDLLRVASFADLVRDRILRVFGLLFILDIIVLMLRSTTSFVWVSSKSTIQLLS